MNVKVCGITNVEDARMVAEAGADAIGVIVDVSVETPRKITVDDAVRIRSSISDIGHAFITVIMPETVEEAVTIYDRVKPDGMQLHGSETAKFIRELKAKTGCQIIKAIHVDNSLDMDYVTSVADYADMLLLDTKVASRVGGTGTTHDYALDKEIKKATGKRIILAGGLNAGNVAAAVAEVKPYVVDVSSGVESEPGVKDPAKVRKFIEVTACL